MTVILQILNVAFVVWALAYALLASRFIFRWRADRNMFFNALATIKAERTRLESEVADISPAAGPEPIRVSVLNCKCQAMSALRSVSVSLERAEELGRWLPSQTVPLLREAEAMLEIAKEYVTLSRTARRQWANDERLIVRSLLEWVSAWQHEIAEKISRAKADGVRFGEEDLRIAKMRNALLADETMIGSDPTTVRHLLMLQIRSLLHDGTRADARIVLCRQILGTAAGIRERLTAARLSCLAFASLSMITDPPVAEVPPSHAKSLRAWGERLAAVAEGIDRAVEIMKSDPGRLVEALIMGEREAAAIGEIEAELAAIGKTESS